MTLLILILCGVGMIAWNWLILANVPYANHFVPFLLVVFPSTGLWTTGVVAFFGKNKIYQAVISGVILSIAWFIFMAWPVARDG